MNYIGSKFSLQLFIENCIIEILKKNDDNREPQDLIFADLFAGTGVVGAYYKKMGYNVIANDIQEYSYVLCKHYIENSKKDLNEEDIEKIFKHLNLLEGNEGYIYNNYSLAGTKGKEFERMYFSDENAKKCDAIRQGIEELYKDNEISDSMYFFTLASLINAIDKVANTASVYGAFLKKLKKSARKPMDFRPLDVIDGSANYITYKEDVNKLIRKIDGDILYLDPPYNARQYCTNYHILETIARYDNPEIHGKTGLRNYKEQKSLYCSKRTVEKAFEYLIKNANFKYIFLSYNNEGLMGFETIKEIMSKHGNYNMFTQDYRRFKADKTENRNHKANSTTEYLHCLVK